jgi:hypothetical protein
VLVYAVGTLVTVFMSNDASRGGCGAVRARRRA